MLKGEVICNEPDKEELKKLISRIEQILDKYPYTTDYNVHTHTSMMRAKETCEKLKQNINTLYIDVDLFERPNVSSINKDNDAFENNFFEDSFF